MAILRSKAALAQIRAAEDLVEAVSYPRKLESAQEHAIEASITNRAILLLEHIAMGADKNGEQFKYEITKITI